MRCIVGAERTVFAWSKNFMRIKLDLIITHKILSTKNHSLDWKKMKTFDSTKLMVCGNTSVKGIDMT